MNRFDRPFEYAARLDNVGIALTRVGLVVVLVWIGGLKVYRYEADGVDALGDRRRRNAGAKPLLSEDDLEALRERLKSPPDDGGIWSGPKVARWIAARRGLVHVHAPRGWEAPITSPLSRASPAFRPGAASSTKRSPRCAKSS